MRPITLFGKKENTDSLTVQPQETSEAEERVRFIDWANGLKNSGALDVWREACAQLRRLSDDVWNGLKFFLTFNGIVIGAAGTIAKLETLDIGTSVVLMVIVSLGLLLTNTAVDIMTKQRDYYSRLLRKKALIEDQLGFYDTQLSGTDLTFAWAIRKEHLGDIKKNPEKWIQEHRFGHNTVTQMLFGIYEGLRWVYAFGLMGLALRIMHLLTVPA